MFDSLYFSVEKKIKVNVIVRCVFLGWFCVLFFILLILLQVFSSECEKYVVIEIELNMKNLGLVDKLKEVWGELIGKLYFFDVQYVLICLQKIFWGWGVNILLWFLKIVFKGV